MENSIIQTFITTIDTLILHPCNFELSKLLPESESKEYAAHTFKIGTFNVKFRIAKITPTKTGQFVTLWKRNTNGLTESHHIKDNFEFYIIGTKKDNLMGVFIFPKSVLFLNKILSDENNKGKNGFRVYPSWDLAENKQALKTQIWQSKYFVKLTENELIDYGMIKSILSVYP